MSSPRPSGPGKLIRIQKDPEDGIPKTQLRSIVSKALGPSANETIRMLQDVCFAVDYRDYIPMKIQTFERTRAIAFADTFEDVTDESLAHTLALEIEQIDLYRRFPEYHAMKETLLAAVEASREAHGGDAKLWLESAKVIARKEAARLLRDGAAEASGDVARLAVDLLERDLPAKQSRNATPPATVVVRDEDAARMAKAIGIIEHKEREEESK